ncbi:MAG: hypothetical protein H0U71_07920 [Gammaproteobacteria bacterium]|nr:hypothetical protein [Gammaproteobacteria bacterium]
MKIHNREALKKLSFIDFNVLNVNIDKKIKEITFRLDGALHLINGIKEELGEGYLKIINYAEIEITSYNARNKSKTQQAEDNYENLNQLCEIDLNDDLVNIKGFAEQTYNWLEFKISGGELIGEFKDKN